MNLNFDDVRTPLVCPRCGAENALTYRDLKTLESIECIGCGTTIRFEKDESFLNLERDANDGLDKFGKSFR